MTLSFPPPRWFFPAPALRARSAPAPALCRPA